HWNALRNARTRRFWHRVSKSGSVDCARCDGIDADIIARAFECGDTSEMNNARFSGRITRGAWRGEHARYRRDIHDRSGFLFAHDWQRCARTEESAIECDFE